MNVRADTRKGVMADEIYVAAQSFVTVVDGKQVFVRNGKTRVRAGHPLLKDNPDAFRPIDVHFDVEQATKAPGERRKMAGKKTTKTATPDA